MTSATTHNALEPYVPDATLPWTPARARHLLRRVRIGAPAPEANRVFTDGPSASVTRLLDEAQAQPLEAPYPAWYSEDGAGWIYDHNYKVQQTMISRLVTDPVHERMAMFWSDLIVTAFAEYSSPIHGFRYTNRLRTYAFGNFKAFIDEIGLDNAMMRYLNTSWSTRWDPNENYGRELLELFTMGITNAAGQPNYTHDDIVAIARSMTGYVAEAESDTYDYTPHHHDDEDKTLFKQRGNWGPSDVVRIIFEERAPSIGRHIAGKLYAHFADERTPNQPVIEAMASLLVSNDWEIRPAVEALLKSRHFYEDARIGCQIKGPVYLRLGQSVEHLRYINAAPTTGELEDVVWVSYQIDQDLLNPQNVAGFPGGRTWISESTLIERDLRSDDFIYGYWDTPELDPMPLLDYVSDPDDPDIVVQELHDMLLAVPLPQAEQDELYNVLLNGLPKPEWRYDDSKPERLRTLLSYLRQRPENQLF
ncbi:MAG: DUF1800 family protein [Bacteroidota bacterium]